MWSEVKFCVVWFKFGVVTFSILSSESPIDIHNKILDVLVTTLTVFCMKNTLNGFEMFLKKNILLR